MSRNLLLAAAVILVAGCNQPSLPPNQSNSTAATPAPATTGAETLPPCNGLAGYQVLPADITLSFPYHLRADRIYVNKNGQERRRVVLEYLDGDADAILAAVDKSMIVAGFVPRPRKEQPNGNIVIAYAQKAYGSIIVVANASAGDKPSNPAARGTVAFDYPSGDKSGVTEAAAPN